MQRKRDLDDQSFVLDQEFILTLTPEDPEGSSRRGHGRIPNLSEVRVPFIDSLIEQINIYFPEGSLKIFNVLLPKNISTAAGSVYTYAATVTSLAEKFGFDAHATSNEFAFLLHSLIEDHHAEFRLHQEQADPINFWNHFLSIPTVTWQNNMRPC